MPNRETDKCDKMGFIQDLEYTSSPSWPSGHIIQIVHTSITINLVFAILEDDFPDRRIKY